MEVSYKELADRFICADNKVEPVLEYLKGLYNLDLTSSEEIRKKLNKYFIPVLKKKLKKNILQQKCFHKTERSMVAKKFFNSFVSFMQTEKKKFSSLF